MKYYIVQCRNFFVMDHWLKRNLKMHFLYFQKSFITLFLLISYGYLFFFCGGSVSNFKVKRFRGQKVCKRCVLQGSPFGLQSLTTTTIRVTGVGLVRFSLSAYPKSEHRVGGGKFSIPLKIGCEAAGGLSHLVHRLP